MTRNNNHHYGVKVYNLRKQPTSLQRPRLTSQSVAFVKKFLITIHLTYTLALRIWSQWDVI